MTATNQLEIARAVRNACVRAALEGYERALIAGLCQEGAWECAVDAMRTLDVEATFQVAEDPPTPGSSSA